MSSEKFQYHPDLVGDERLGGAPTWALRQEIRREIERIETGYRTNMAGIPEHWTPEMVLVLVEVFQAKQKWQEAIERAKLRPFPAATLLYKGSLETLNNWLREHVTGEVLKTVLAGDYAVRDLLQDLAKIEDGLED